MQMNSIKQLLSSPGIKVVEAADFYLPDESWESIFKFLINDDNHRCLKSLSIVSKQFLSITNRLLFSLAVYNPTRPFLPSLFNRFSSLNSLRLKCYKDCFPLLEELDLSYPIELQNHESLLNGIEVLSSALFKLRKVNLTAHH
ncbi:F-box/LRR-repeat protein [Trifolium repens]|nr:F-box/LRR-repeat protein [Trifolium repens]